MRGECFVGDEVAVAAGLGYLQALTTGLVDLATLTSICFGPQYPQTRRPSKSTRTSTSRCCTMSIGVDMATACDRGLGGAHISSRLRPEQHVLLAAALIVGRHVLDWRIGGKWRQWMWVSVGARTCAWGIGTSAAVEWEE